MASSCNGFKMLAHVLVFSADTNLFLLTFKYYFESSLSISKIGFILELLTLIMMLGYCVDLYKF